MYHAEHIIFYAPVYIMYATIWENTLLHTIRHQHSYQAVSSQRDCVKECQVLVLKDEKQMHNKRRSTRAPTALYSAGFTDNIPDPDPDSDPDPDPDPGSQSLDPSASKRISSV